MIWVFHTKGSTNKFVDAFANNSGKRTVVLKNQEGKTGERFYNYSWINFRGHMNEGDEFCFQGLLRGAEQLKSFMKTNKWYYFDQPYFYYTHYQEHPDFKDIWYRITVNDVQTNKIDNNPKHLERYKNLLQKSPDEITLQDWRKDGDHILVIPPSYHTARWYEFGEQKWVQNTVKEIKKHTDRPIVVRWKYKDGVQFGDRVDIDRPLSEDLKNCWAMVSFHSMCASHAVRRGIPSFSSEHSPAYPVSYGLNQLNMIEQPKMPDREKWISTLLGSQFTLGEMKSGFAYRYLNEL